MIQMFFLLVVYVLVAILSVAGVVCLLIALNKRKNNQSFKGALIASGVLGLLVLIITNINLTSTETTNREEALEVWIHVLGFTPLEVVEEIKHKHFVLYDASVHWLSFTYDSMVFEKILLHEKKMLKARKGTKEFEYIITEFFNENENRNAPDWFATPTPDVECIYYKNNKGLNSNFGDYLLWHSGKITYLVVSDSD